MKHPISDSELSDSQRQGDEAPKQTLALSIAREDDSTEESKADGSERSHSREPPGPTGESATPGEASGPDWSDLSRSLQYLGIKATV
eukprot:scaffold565609_cov43-Prasinocladus_malaysianus.AAC.1